MEVLPYPDLDEAKLVRGAALIAASLTADGLQTVEQVEALAERYVDFIERGNIPREATDPEAMVARTRQLAAAHYEQRKAERESSKVPHG